MIQTLLVAGFRSGSSGRSRGKAGSCTAVCHACTEFTSATLTKRNWACGAALRGSVVAA